MDIVIHMVKQNRVRLVLAQRNGLQLSQFARAFHSLLRDGPWPRRASKSQELPILSLFSRARGEYFQFLVQQIHGATTENYEKALEAGELLVDLFGSYRSLLPFDCDSVIDNLEGSRMVDVCMTKVKDFLHLNLKRPASSGADIVETCVRVLGRFVHLEQSVSVPAGSQRSALLVLLLEIVRASTAGVSLLGAILKAIENCIGDDVQILEEHSTCILDSVLQRLAVLASGSEGAATDATMEQVQQHVIPALSSMFCGRDQSLLLVEAAQKLLPLAMLHKYPHLFDRSIVAEVETSIASELQLVRDQYCALQTCTASHECTFAASGRSYPVQEYYYCFTCWPERRMGCCVNCAGLCHKDHELSEMHHAGFFCDCGARNYPEKKNNEDEEEQKIQAEHQLGAVDAIPLATQLAHALKAGDEIRASSASLSSSAVRDPNGALSPVSCCILLNGSRVEQFCDINHLLGATSEKHCKRSGVYCSAGFPYLEPWVLHRLAARRQKEIDGPVVKARRQAGK
jgi:hypothetical protein